MYQNLNRLNHLTNFIEDGGKRINYGEDNSNLFGDKITIITVVKILIKILKKQSIVFRNKNSQIKNI